MPTQATVATNGGNYTFPPAAPLSGWLKDQLENNTKMIVVFQRGIEEKLFESEIWMQHCISTGTR